jgi:hypothetical protein
MVVEVRFGFDTVSEPSMPYEQFDIARVGRVKIPVGCRSTFALLSLIRPRVDPAGHRQLFVIDQIAPIFARKFR